MRMNLSRENETNRAPAEYTRCLDFPLKERRAAPIVNTVLAGPALDHLIQVPRCLREIEMVKLCARGG